MTNDATRGWTFAPYEKISDRTERWSLDEAALRSFSRTPWLVTEKIHGAHFVLVTDGVSIRAAKRKGFLDEGEDFFGHHTVVERLRESVLRLFSIVASENATSRYPVDRIAIHGELFGGHYPHPDVAAIPGVFPVQTGVHYSPRIEFFAYDIALLREPRGARPSDAPGSSGPADTAGPADPANRSRTIGEVSTSASSASEREYLDADRALAVLAAAGVPTVTPLLIGTYEEACAFPNEFDSLVARQLGLPPLGHPNLAEGVVVKPLRANLLRGRGVAGSAGQSGQQGRLGGAGGRPVLKRKIAAFSEDSRYHQALRHEPPPPVPGVLGMLRLEGTERTNEARLWSVASKIGRIERDDLARREVLVHDLAEDVLSALSEIYPQVAALSPRARQSLETYLTDEAHALVDLILDDPAVR